MPFTPAHVAAVLPVVGRERPRWVVPAALVVGSMVPDVLYFVPLGDYRAVSHSLRGLVTLDLLLGLVLTGLWRVAAAPVLRDLAPRAVRERVPVPRGLDRREWSWSVPCVLLGGLTHLLWDSFTHSDGWAVHRWPQVLEHELLGGWPVYGVAQYASSVLGLLVVAWWCRRLLSEVPAVHPALRRVSAREARVVGVLAVALPLLVAIGFVAWVATATQGSLMLLYVAVVRGISAFGLVAALVVLWWHLVVSRRPAPAGGTVG
jgi:hypothetical protein